MTKKSDSFSIRLTKSRLEKGLLAIPKKHADLFPDIRCDIDILFDDSEKTQAKKYVPDNAKIKENRIFALGTWFIQHEMKPNDRLTISVINQGKRIYRLSLDRYLRVKKEAQVRQAFRAAQSEETAVEQFKALAKITRKGKRRVARDALLELARDSSLTIRRRSKGSNSKNNAVVSPAIRVLLRELHGGKCQICSFTFRKKSGDPYFEVHHIDPNVGDLPTNILVLCPNCHAQIEQADVCDFRRAGDWLVGVTINGKRRKIRQPFATHSTAGAATILRMLFFLAQTGSSVISVWRG